MRILADIGGTYARFAVEESGAPVHIKKYAAADFATFGATLEQYRAECGIKETSELLIATAAHPDEKNIWRFVNKNEWIIDPKVLGNVALILNDFEASTWGLKGVSARMPSVLIGPGTGLGLGYVIPGANGIHIQGTQGGHLPAAAVTDEQSRVLKAVEKVKQRNGFVVYEDVVSGPGLFNLYAALCSLSDETQIATTAEEMMTLEKSLAVRESVRLFHEFFGLFAATVTVGAGAYGGLYLTGGVLDRLAEKNKLDLAHFKKYFAGDFVPSVKKSLEQTPITHITDPYLSLHGLLRAADA